MLEWGRWWLALELACGPRLQHLDIEVASWKDMAKI